MKSLCSGSHPLLVTAVSIPTLEEMFTGSHAFLVHDVTFVVREFEDAPHVYSCTVGTKPALSSQMTLHEVNELIVVPVFEYERVRVRARI